MSDLYIGLMSGTSMDGIDAVVVRFDGATPHLVAHHCERMPDELREALLDLSEPDSSHSLYRLGEIDHLFARLLATTVHRLLDKGSLGANRIRALGSHGQTICHQPQGATPFTIQIGDPSLIAELTGITTVADFRRRDIAAGGQGAPLAPAYHAALFHTADEARVIINIGGIANVTLLPEDGPISGFDTGPGNVLLDTWARKVTGVAFDREGAMAARGTVDQALIRQMLSDPYFHQISPKSTGREHFNWHWLETHLRETSLSPEDVQATLSELTAISISNAIKGSLSGVERVLVCGGGVHNIDLLDRLRSHLDTPCISTAELGLDPDWVEAVAIAWLTRQTLAMKPGNIPAVTGARRPVVLGGVYYGN